MSGPWIAPENISPEEDRARRRKDQYVVVYRNGSESQPFTDPIEARHHLDTPPYGRRMIRVRDRVTLAHRVSPDLRLVKEGEVAVEVEM